MSTATLITLWMLVGIAINISVSIENYQKKRFADISQIDERMEKGKVPVWLQYVLYIILLVFVAGMMSALWPITVYGQIRNRRMDGK